MTVAAASVRTVETGKGIDTMIRRRGRSWLAASLLAITLLAAPAAWAAGGSGYDAGSLWTSVENWFQHLMLDWFGLDSENSGPESIYNGAGDSTDPEPPESPMSVGPGGGGASTTDGSNQSDPNGG